MEDSLSYLDNLLIEVNSVWGGSFFSSAKYNLLK